MSALVLAVSPTAQQTAMTLFQGLEPIRAQTSAHGEDELRSRRVDQRGLRTKAIRTFLQSAGVLRGGLAAVAVQGGILRPVEGGTYLVCDSLLRDAERAGEDHPANMGAPLAHAIAAEWGCPAFVVDPETVDEREMLARLAQSCCLDAPRTPALAMRAAARHHARAVNRPVESLRLVAAHLGSRVSLCAHRGGRMVDVVELWQKSNPCGHSCGAPRQEEVLDPGWRTAFSPAQLIRPDGVPRLALARAERGDGSALLLLQAVAYRIARAVGELATALEGEVDAVLLTGALAGAGSVIAEVCRRVEWIAPVFLYEEDDELLALAEGALRALSGEEPAKNYA